MTRLSEVEHARCIGYLKAFQTDLLSMVHDSWVNTGIPLGGAYVRSGRAEDIPGEGLLIPEIAEGVFPEFRIIYKSPTDLRTVAVASIRYARENDYYTMCTGPLSGCTLLSEVIVKAKTILLNADS